MTEEEYFRKNYPESCYGDKPLSPHWDFFQDGVEFGERESEKKIEELKAQLEREKKEEMEEVASALAYQRTVGVDNRIAELEEKLANADYQLEGRDLEIKELKAQLEQEKNLNQCLSDHNEQLRELIEKMKSDITEEIGFAKNFDELHTYSVLNNLLNKWKIKENA